MMQAMSSGSIPCQDASKSKFPFEAASTADSEIWLPTKSAPLAVGIYDDDVPHLITELRDSFGNLLRDTGLR